MNMLASGPSQHRWVREWMKVWLLFLSKTPGPTWPLTSFGQAQKCFCYGLKVSPKDLRCNSVEKEDL